MKAILFSILLCSSVSVLAKSKLKKDLVSELKDKDLLQDVRVYVNKKTISTFFESVKADTQVDNGKVEGKIKQEKVKVIVKRDIRGKIVLDEDNIHTLWVSFHSDCEDVECSYKFEWNERSYELFGVPNRNGKEPIKVRAGLFASRRPLDWNIVRLKIKKKEILETIRKKEYADGHQ